MLFRSDNFSVPNAIRGIGRSITSDVFGNVYTAAETDSSGLFGFSILKYDTAGNLKNHAKITPPTCLYSAAIDIVVGPKQQAIMFGHFSDGSISSGVIIELDSSGVLKWLHQTSGYETAYNSGVVDDDNNLYVCGSIKTGSANDLLVQKFEPLITLGLSSVSTAGELSVFPNPVSGFVKVKSSDTIHKIIIYDATMKVVFERDFGNEKNIDLDMHQLPCGFYFLKVNGHMEKIIKN